MVRRALLVGILCSVFTWLDFKKPLVLVRRGEMMGAYRAGLFVTEFPVSRATEFQLRMTNTLRELMSFGMLGPIATIAVIAMPFGTIYWFWVLGGAVAMDLTVVGTVRSRLLSRHYLLPDTVARDHVAFTRTSLRRAGLIR